MTTETTTTAPAPRPTPSALRRWANEHGVAVSLRGGISDATWAKWDEWYHQETAPAAAKLRAAMDRAEKAFLAATEHVQKHFED